MFRVQNPEARQCLVLPVTSPIPPEDHSSNGSACRQQNAAALHTRLPCQNAKPRYGESAMQGE
jgi:hypothetical protein